MLAGFRHIRSGAVFGPVAGWRGIGTLKTILRRKGLDVMATEILSMLSAGGDIGTMVLVLVLWKFEKRLTLVEWNLATLSKKVG